MPELPASLEALEADSITEFSALPKKLKSLSAYNATKLPEKLPAGLEYLFINGVVAIPELPKSLVVLFAKKVARLPPLPPSLESLYAPNALNKEERIQEQQRCQQSYEQSIGRLK